MAVAGEPASASPPTLTGLSPFHPSCCPPRSCDETRDAQIALGVLSLRVGLPDDWHRVNPTPIGTTADSVEGGLGRICAALRERSNGRAGCKLLPVHLKLLRPPMPAAAANPVDMVAADNLSAPTLEMDADGESRAAAGAAGVHVREGRQRR